MCSYARTCSYQGINDSGAVSLHVRKIIRIQLKCVMLLIYLSPSLVMPLLVAQQQPSQCVYCQSLRLFSFLP